MYYYVKFENGIPTKLHSHTHLTPISKLIKKKKKKKMKKKLNETMLLHAYNKYYIHTVQGKTNTTTSVHKCIDKCCTLFFC